MAKYGINKTMGLKVVGILDVRPDEQQVYVEIDGETYSLFSLLDEYDGQDIEVKTSKAILPDGLEPEDEDDDVDEDE